MSLDELTVIHEHLETLTGIDWQLLYVPLVIPGAVAAIVVLRELYETKLLSAILFAGGIVCWVVSQLFEHLEWSSATEPIHPGLIPPEEILEMTGSCLFGFAALVAIRALLERRASAPAG
jgi:hypothetical protein